MNTHSYQNLVIILLFVAFGCKNGANKQQPENNPDSIKKYPTEIQSSNENVIKQHTISPFKEVDSLVQLLNGNFAFSDLRELNRICLTSHGELTETLDVIAVDLLNNHLDKFLEYLQRNPESCLEKRIIDGLAAKYCAYEKTERPGMLRKEQNQLISIARKEKMETKKIEFINNLFNKVDPNLFD